MAFTCFEKYQNGEISNVVAVTDCSDATYRSELGGAGFPYMDLVELYLGYRKAIAKKFDAGELSEDEAGLRLSEILARVNGEIERRNASRAQQKLAQQQAAAQWMAGYGQLLQGLAAWQPQQSTVVTIQPNTPITCWRSGNFVHCQ